jgi:hypothetical protein
MYNHAEIAHWLQNQNTMKIIPAQVVYWMNNPEQIEQLYF